MEKLQQAHGKRAATDPGIAHGMISRHPYNTWPLRVKFFTDEAEKAWISISKSGPTLPPQFTCTTELEGVDGKSGHKGSGRVAPINVTDEEFTTAYLHKAQTISSRSSGLTCSVCYGPVDDFTSNPLETALCPSFSCTSISHLVCLAHGFLKSTASSSTQSELIPRGGECRSCHEYVLWGDIIRGCFRRQKGGIVLEPVDEAEEEAEGMNSDETMSVSEAEERHAIVLPATRKPSRAKATSKDKSVKASTGKASKTVTRKKSIAAPSKLEKGTKRGLHVYAANSDPHDGDSSEGEFFDLNGIGSSEESDGAPLAPQRLIQRTTYSRPLIPIFGSQPSHRSHIDTGNVAQGEIDFFEVDDEEECVYPARVEIPRPLSRSPSRAFSALSLSSPARSSDDEQQHTRDVIEISD
ncbi:hypothetical protein PHLCEN_2v9011 [Hermanssonia centrifuga]|uniref:Structure-specific endonuclease subunit SLX1 C-terminal domain-containing protein n=1 Tax=Hermanssonia centrifuga TaxID=98765 RepID=A0A2R6NS68_9APHY|nr:hypothetical protein PHLCEN_2v9011 [Hermanssonia centrifuga]